VSASGDSELRSSMAKRISSSQSSSSGAKVIKRAERLGAASA